LNDSQDPTEESESPIRPPCSRAEAIEIAVWTILFGHVVVCVLTLTLLATLFSGAGVWLGIGAVALLAMAIPFVILPIGALIGVVSHKLFNGTSVSVEFFARSVSIVFELHLFAWIVVLAIWLQD